MANDGTITFSVWLDADSAEKELNNIKKKILALRAELATQQNARNDMAERLHKIADAAVEAHEKLEQMRETGAAAPAIEEQKKIVSGLDVEFSKANTALQEQDQNIDKINHRLETLQNQYGITQKAAMEAGTAGSRSASSAGNTVDSLTKRLNKAVKKISNIAAGALVFSLFGNLFRSFRDYVGNALQTNEEFSASVAKLKGAFLAGFTPIFNFVIPALTALINILTRAIALFSSLVSQVLGLTAEASAAAAENLYDEANALDKVGGGAGKTAKQLASFDEINKLSDSTSGGGGVSGQKKPDFTSIIGNQLKEIEIYLAGGLLSVGALLTFTGVNIPLGLGLMAVGAVTLGKAIAQDWDTMPDNIRKALTTTLAVLSAGMLVVGAILALSGANLPLGIGLMAAGAASLGTAIALNWDAIRDKIQSEFGPILALLGAGLLVVGAVLAFSGASLPLGIGLMVAGAASLGTAAALNWDKLKADMSGAFGGIMAIASGGLLVLGLILALSGVALPLGIGLMVAGAAGLATVTTINWDAIKDEITGAWDRIKSWWTTNVAPIFTTEFWRNKFSSILKGFRVLWNELIEWLTGAWNNLKKWWDSLTLGSPKVQGTTVNDAGFSHSSGKFGISANEIPHLAAGAVIPPNQQFLAMLGDQTSGTNIEAPLDTIVAAFRQAINESGAGQRQLVLQIGEREFATLVFDAFRDESGRIGTAMVR